MRIVINIAHEPAICQQVFFKKIIGGGFRGAEELVEILLYEPLAKVSGEWGFYHFGTVEANIDLPLNFPLCKGGLRGIYITNCI